MGRRTAGRTRVNDADADADADAAGARQPLNRLRVNASAIQKATTA
jgi:hypothetical protein